MKIDVSKYKEKYSDNEDLLVVINEIEQDIVIAENQYEEEIKVYKIKNDQLMGVITSTTKKPEPEKTENQAPRLDLSKLE